MKGACVYFHGMTLAWDTFTPLNCITTYVYNSDRNGALVRVLLHHKMAEDGLSECLHPEVSTY